MNPLLLKAIAALGALLLVILVVADRNRWRSKAQDRQDQITQTCAAVRAAVGKPKLDCRQADRQIAMLGTGVRDLTAAANRAAIAINRLADDTKAAKAAAAEASRKAAQRARGVETTSAGLAASARSGERMARPCEPSEALKEVWR